MDEILLILIFIIILVLIIVIMGIIGWVIVKVKTAKTQIKLAEAEIDKKKLEFAMKRAIIDDLRSASVLLNDKERSQLDAIRADNSILSRKLIFSENEFQDRLKRLELGSSLGKLNLNLGIIKSKESKLFGPDAHYYKKKKRVVKRRK